MHLETWLKCLPWGVVCAAGLLVAIGWLGIARSEELSGGNGRFVRLQAVWSVAAMVAMLATTIPSYRLLCRWSYAIFACSIVLLAIVYWAPPIHGARRWIRIGPIGFQPSEFAKLALVVGMARYLMYRENYRRLRGLLWPLGLTMVPVVLILREPDLGTAMVLLPVLFAMLFAAGARWRDLACLAAIGLLALPLLWTQMSLEQKSRVTSLFEQAEPGEAARGDAYHLRQGKQMLALGNVWGSLLVGQTVDDPAVYHLPEARTDFVLCVIGERLGLPGIAGVLVLFAVLVSRAMAVAQRTREPFGRLLCVGLASLLAVQVLINTGMTVGLLPITGLSLPMVSYGGSGLVAQGLLVGLVANVGLRPGYEITNEPFRFVTA